MKKLITLCLVLICLFFACNKSDRPVYIPKGDPDVTAFKTYTTFASAMSATVAAQDAYVRDAQYASKNYNTSVLEVKGQASKYTGYKRNAYLSFDIPAGSFSSVKLKLYGKNTEASTGIAISVYRSEAFTESTVTYNTRPAHDATPSATTYVGVNGWYEWDVTSIAQAGTLNLCLKNPSNQDDLVSFSSSEGTNGPQLVFSTTDTPAEPDQPGIEDPTKPDKIITVWFENKGYSQIVGSSSAPYINSLISKGTLFTASHGITHPSYPNYIAWFSGSTQGINTDACVSGAPYSTQNLYTALNSVGRTFCQYSEGLPAVGSETCSSGYYREKHNPVTIFSNVPKSANQPLTAINLTDTSTFKNLPNVVSITPNMLSDMHDQTVAYGDNWLKSKLGKLIDWCSRNNAVFIVTMDEDQKMEGNRIATVAIGKYVKAGYQAPENVNHYSFTNWILRMNGASTDIHSNVKNAAPIGNIFK